MSLRLEQGLGVSNLVEHLISITRRGVNLEILHLLTMAEGDSTILSE